MIIDFVDDDNDDEQASLIYRTADISAHEQHNQDIWENVLVKYANYVGSARESPSCFCSNKMLSNDGAESDRLDSLDSLQFE